jgi:peptidoglycan/LPS O-acetylase OafA/YrhL
MLDVRAEERVEADAGQTPAVVAERRRDIDYLRGAIVLLVVWHHSILAYASLATINRENPIETFTPVADARRWPGFDLLAGFNDVFFMALLFFVSGLFVWRSLTRKGTGAFARDRLIRLGVPFLVALPILIPLAYYPAQLNVELVFGGDTSFLEFWWQMVRSGFGTAGPLWFLWLLLVFDGLIALAYRVRRRHPETSSLPAPTRPLRFFAVLVMASTAAYLPLVFLFGPLDWIGAGPFVVQTSRVFFYLVYFLAGVVVGAYGLERGLLARGGALAGRWWVWLSLALLLFAVLIAQVVATPPRPLAGALAFTIACAALVIASLAFAVRFFTGRWPLFESFADNAYGIYIVHYAFVTWLQYALLGADLSAVTKAVLVFAGTVILSWGLILSLRRVPAIARVI